MTPLIKLALLSAVFSTVFAHLFTCWLAFGSDLTSKDRQDIRRIYCLFTGAAVLLAAASGIYEAIQ